MAVWDTPEAALVVGTVPVTPGHSGVQPVSLIKTRRWLSQRD